VPALAGEILTSSAGGASAAGRSALLYGEAALLFAAYQLAVGRIESSLRIRLAATPGGFIAAAVVELLVVAGVVLLINGLRAHRSGSYLPTTNVRAVLARCGGALGLLGLMALAVRFLAPGLDAWEFARRGMGAPGALGRFLWTLPAGVAAEELVFRACQDRLRTTLGTGPTLVAIPLLFALYHGMPSALLSLRDAALLGALVVGGGILAWLYEASGSLAALVAVHLAYDSLAVGQGWLHVYGHRLAEGALWVTWLAGSAGLTIAIARVGRPRREATRDATSREVGEPSSATSPLAASWLRWAAALVLAFGLPALLAWIRQVR
jgi:hypothetical protein